MAYSSLATLLVFVFGLLVGSFINVVALRLPQGQSFVKGHSRCPYCHKKLHWPELVPVVSWLMQHGRCRSCNRRIHWRYPLVEMVTGGLFAAVWWQFGDSPALTALVWAFVAMLVIIFLIDLKEYLILDKTTIPAFVLAVVVSVMLHRSWPSIGLGIFIGAGFFLVQFLLSRGKWVGGGDVRLGAVMGASLGWQQTLLALLIAYVIGALVAVGLLAAKRKTAGDHLPMGTFLVIGTVTMVLFGEYLLEWFVEGLYL